VQPDYQKARRAFDALARIEQQQRADARQIADAKTTTEPDVDRIEHYARELAERRSRWVHIDMTTKEN
jgi:adenylosuccinate lyase